ncbi:MAG: ABC transporter ATP-binding protein [Clostridia bacterium]|nr:ABC transporter ATP-binding protein [Clostridia bacterium]
MRRENLKENLSVLKGIWKYVVRHRLLVILSFVLAAAGSVLMLLIPKLVGEAIDGAVAAGQVDFEAIMPILLEIALLSAGIALSVWLLNICNNHVVYQVLLEIRTDAFRHIQKLPLSYLDTKPGGDIVSRIISDADQFSEGLLLGFTQLFSGVVTIVATIVFMFLLSPVLALVVVVLTPLSWVTAHFIAKRTYGYFSEQSAIRGEQTALISEMIGGQKIVQAFRHEEQSQKAFDEVNGRLCKASLRATFLSSMVNPSTRCINAIVFAAVALAGGLSVISAPASFTVGSLAAFLSYASQYTKPFNEISGVIAELQNAIACAKRLLELIAQPPMEPDSPDALALNDAKGQVDFDNVSFSYLPEQRLIEDLDLHVSAGQRVAIVGPTGSGKTTLMNLLMRFYETREGEIRVDGHPVRSVTRPSLRSSFGMVLQETWIKNATVRENIALGNPDATTEQIEQAAKEAHADGFIRRLPQGYDTVLGDDEGGLSQGQKQLLCIARVFLCLPPMLILDEATSSIDARTELKIGQAFAKLMKGRTSFIVAHRLSTVREADMILVMKEGHVVEIGTHEQLIAMKGFYYSLHQSQFDIV